VESGLAIAGQRDVLPRIGERAARDAAMAMAVLGGLLGLEYGAEICRSFVVGFDVP